MTKKAVMTIAKSARAVGRPRALTLNEILDAANAMGLSGISMPALAAKLGIGTATLYNYVTNRDDLLRRAAVRQSRLRRLDDLDQDWRSLVRTHARQFFAFCSAEPQIIIQHMHGTVGPDAVIDYLDTFLMSMARRGFAPDDAYRIYSAVNNVVLGAVVRQAYVKASAGTGVGHAEAVRRCLRERDRKDLSYVRACTAFADVKRAYDFEDALARMIDSFVAEFGSGRNRLPPTVKRARKRGAP
jgi:AcrR family transcriptional regulator